MSVHVPPSTVTLLDDDGVLVISSARRMAAQHAGEGAFDYDYPNALVADMRADAVVAWKTDVEGDVDVRITTGVPDGRLRIAGRLRVEEGDELLALTYSQYTYACDVQHGAPERIEGLCEPFSLEPGLYRVHVGPFRFPVEPGMSWGFEARLERDDTAAPFDGAEPIQLG